MIDEWKKQYGKIMNPKRDLQQLTFKIVSSVVCQFEFTNVQY